MNALSNLLSIITTPFRQLLMVPLQVVSTPKRFWGLSLPRRASILVFLMLSVLAVVCFFLWKHNDQGVEWEHAWKYVLIVAVLIVMTSIVVDYMVKTWLDHDVSGFPDIDEAWEHGLEELRAAGLSLSDLPLFLVLGASEDAQAKSLLGASTLPLTVSSVPSGDRSPLRWFAGPDGAVLVISHAGRLSRLSAKSGEPVSDVEIPMQHLGTLAPPMTEFGRTAAPFAEADSFAPSWAVGSGTVTSGGSQPAYMAGGTLTPDFGAEAHEQPPRGALAGPAIRSRSAPVTLTKDQAETASARLEHVCRLLCEERLPLCPINGILIVLPFDLIARGEAETSEVHISVRMDLSTLSTVLRLRSQVVALFGGMERADGFTELMRRLGPKVANEQQFGKGYNPHCAPLDEELSAVAQHACGAFEDWTYHLFAQKSSRHSNPRGNRQLYSLVCKIRSLQRRVEDVIVKGFSSDGDLNSEKPHLFSGCYFAATGEKDDRRAFVSGVFKNRLLAQDEDVEWTKESLAENEWFQWIANLLVAADVLLIGAIVVMIVFWWK